MIKKKKEKKFNVRPKNPRKKEKEKKKKVQHRQPKNP